MTEKQFDPYGLKNPRPPYSLYQAPDGKWGLIDGDGNHRAAIFTRSESDPDIFRSAPWESVFFDERRGMDLLAWYDPSEVWFNFTFDDDAYPKRWGKYLWEQEGDFSDYRRVYAGLLPEVDRWILDAIEEQQAREHEIDNINDWDREEQESRLLADELTLRYPGLNDIAASNALLARVLDSDDIDIEAKATLWLAKVYLDNFLNEYKTK